MMNYYVDIKIAYKNCNDTGKSCWFKWKNKTQSFCVFLSYVQDNHVYENCTKIGYL